MVSRNFKLLKVLSTLFRLTKIWELFWFSVTKSEDSEPLPLSSPMSSRDNMWQQKSITLCYLLRLHQILSQGKTSQAIMYRGYAQKPFKSTPYFEFSE